MIDPLRPLAAIALALVAGCGTSVADARSPDRASAANPVVVELFQSQGCSSCPPANANVNAIAGRPDILALSFAVTYWDRLGWKDTFASPRNTSRQWDYARAGGRGNVATPQVIVNGGAAIVGSNRQQLDATIARAGPPRGGPVLAIDGATLRVGMARAARAPATIWLVRYDPRAIDVPIKAGENNGRTLPHRNIVRDMVKIGDWTGPARSFALPAAPRGLSSAVLVQRGVGGPIIAAQKV